ncbi:ABC transporter substrate-binding protein [Streptacidiphilus sp. MAP5-3]|uniref:ABC transporter substrate-binding protein n=1 Tax=unclassified Streptacidiphilus TaxID=2643834 RepID=UPI00351750AC
MSALKRLAALSCVGLIATTTACGSSKSTGPVDGAPNVTINVGSATPFTTLDPANAYDSGSWNVYYNIYQQLFTYMPGANLPTPDAAKDCTNSGVTVTCDLQPGLEFSNGDALDANAVKFSLDRVLAIKSKTGVSGLLSTIKSIDVLSPTRFVLHLTEPDATMEDRLASGVASIVDPKVYSATQAEPNTFSGVVGSGRYVVQSAQWGNLGGGQQPTELKLALNPNYKGAATAPQNSYVDVKYYADQNGTKKALDDKDADVVIQDLNANDVVTMQNNQQLGSGLQVAQGPGGQVRMMSFNTKKAPFNDVHVRQAVAELINRSQIASGPYQHTVTPAYSLMPAGIANSSQSFSMWSTPQRTDGEVRQQLKDAGVSLPVKFTLSYGGGDAAKEAETKLIAQQLNSTGIFQVGLQGFPGGVGQMQSAILTSGNFQAFMIAWEADYLDADDYISPIVEGNALYNNYNNPTLDQEISQALSITPRTSAEKAYKQIQNTIAQDVPVIPIWTNSQYAASQANITGVPLTLDDSGTPRWWLIGKTSN